MENDGLCFGKRKGLKLGCKHTCLPYPLSRYPHAHGDMSVPDGALLVMRLL